MRIKLLYLLGLIVFIQFSASCIRRPVGNLTDQSGLSISGTVRDAQGPVEGAVVRIQASSTADTTDADGKYLLQNLVPDQAVRISAWAHGYYITGGLAVDPGSDSVDFVLTPIHLADHPDYEWVSAFSESPGAGNCQNCHAGPEKNLPFDEWIQDAHAHSVDNIRFQTMYAGTDVNGNRSPATRFGYNRDYGQFPLAPDPDMLYYGPGYKLDFPEAAGNCAACHAPAAAIDAPYQTDPSALEGVGAEGIGCDFCHKVWDVTLNPSTGMPYDNRPGVLSFQFRRPPGGHQYFAGPLDDIAPGEDTCTPVQRESRYCAPCHFAKFWDVTVYNSFGEWLESPYSDPANGQTCQDCHMPAGLSDHFALPAQGGLQRDPQSLFSHRMPGARDESLLRNAVTMTADARRKPQGITVNVRITNDKTGHHVPTDSPLRHLILVVEACDADGRPLTQTSGPELPDWCGQGDKADGCYAGLPGKTYAKILEEAWTGVSPTGAYWNMTRLVSDNRIAAFASDESAYTFEASSK